MENPDHSFTWNVADTTEKCASFKTDPSESAQITPLVNLGDARFGQVVSLADLTVFQLYACALLSYNCKF